MRSEMDGGGPANAAAAAVGAAAIDATPPITGYGTGCSNESDVRSAASAVGVCAGAPCGDLGKNAADAASAVGDDGDMGVGASASGKRTPTLAKLAM